MKKMFKHNCKILILFLVFDFVKLQSENVGTIYSFEEPDSNIIYLEPCLINNTTMIKFIVQSYITDTTLIVAEKFPTFVLESAPNSSTNEDYLSFDATTINNFPIKLDKNKSIDTIKINLVSLQPDVGRREAKLTIGFLYLDDTGSATPQLLKVDTFFLIGKNTNKFIDGYDDYVKFDSVFINQTKPVTKILKVKNTYINNINAIKQNWNLISEQQTEQELFIENKEYPITFFPGKAFKEWKIEYNPKDIMPDTAEINIIFIPNDNKPNEFDTVKAKIYGTGVKQSFNVVKNTNCEVNQNIDTINFGKIIVGTTKNATISIRNIGNINYKLVNQNIFDQINDTEIDYFNIEKPLSENKNEININQIDSFTISFTPNRNGTLIARYVLENNFKERKILSNNIENYKKTIVIIGTGVEPILKIEKDSINFGNINYANANINCPTEKDSSITLFNTGNSELIIYDIKTNNPAIFQISTTDTIIPPNSQVNIKITFIAKRPDILIEQTHLGNISFKTNENLNETKINYIYLTGKAIPPINAAISIPNMKAKPGTILEIPIEITNFSDNNPITQYISNYNIQINYNPALLSFNNFITIGTATEGTNNISVNETNGNLIISAQNQTSTLKPNKILIKLQFHTFLGNNSQTEIAINNAKFGINNICDDYFQINMQNGSFSIDSIPGLELKLNNLAQNNYDFQINEINKNEININFTLPFQTFSQLFIANYLGTKIISENFTAQKGNYSRTISLNNLNTGFYYIIFQSGLFYKAIPFIKK